ncbi:MAG: hypothetical protein HC811_10720 [Flammeovirgaceae bacterium]|nr:hypothetical protein [Flammeovirgaceae bacterium]
MDGSYSFKEKNNIDLNVVGKNTTVQTLISLLPEETSEKLSQYHSSGDAYLEMKVNGEVGPEAYPSLKVTFGLSKATLYHPDIQTKIQDVNLEGSYANPSMLRPETASLTLKNMKGDLNARNFSANLSIKNFNNPFVVCDFSGELEITSLFSFYPMPDIKNPKGILQADISLAGEIELLKHKATAQQVKTTGHVVMQNLQFDYGAHDALFREINGTLQFNNNDLAISNVNLRLGNSDFLLNGFLKTSSRTCSLKTSRLV